VSKFLKVMVGARGFEPPTPCAQGLHARETNDLHGVIPMATEKADWPHFSGLRGKPDTR
jgi:hypothetical protein